MYKQIKGILSNHLDQMPYRPPVAWDNMFFEAKEDELYLEPKLFPGSVFYKFLGGNTPQYARGIYQINIKAPKGTGWSDVADVVESIEEWFYRGLVLTDGDLKLRIEKLEFSPSIYSHDGKYVVSVSIYFYYYY